MGNFGMLPEEIRLDILSRLPTESVLECKLVSKAWKNVVKHSSFSTLHLHRLNNLDSGKISCIYMTIKHKDGLYFLEYDENSSQTPSHKVKKMSLNPPFRRYGLVNSCNGLICLSGLPALYTGFALSTNYNDVKAGYVPYICNPITRESVTLPELETSDPVDFLLYGFGYIPSTDEYKVVRLYQFMRQDTIAHIDVYTLGSGKGWRNGWRNKEKTILSYGHTWQQGVFVNGCICWAFGNQNILAYDLADEMFVKFPEYPEFWMNFGISSLGDCLCATHYLDAKNSDVWLLRKNQNESLMSWSKEFSMVSEDDELNTNTPFSLSSSDTALCRSGRQLCLHDLKSSCSKVLVDCGEYLGKPILHINTLVFVESIRRENTKTLESGDSATEEAKVRDPQMKQH